MAPQRNLGQDYAVCLLLFPVCCHSSSIDFPIVSFLQNASVPTLLPDLIPVEPQSDPLKRCFSTFHVRQPVGELAQTQATGGLYRDRFSSSGQDLIIYVSKKASRQWWTQQPLVQDCSVSLLKGSLLCSNPSLFPLLDSNLRMCLLDGRLYDSATADLCRHVSSPSPGDLSEFALP